MKAWGEHLREHRKARGLSYHDIADRVGVSENDIRAWESGKDWPTKRQVLVKLYGSLRAMRNFEKLIPTDDFKTDPWQKVIEASNGETKQEPVVEDLSFGRKLQQARNAAGCTQRELGELFQDVRPQMLVSRWEGDHARPSRSDYAKLCELFPALVGHWNPDDLYDSHRTLATPANGHAATVLETMQMPEFNKAAQAAFSATPMELGQAAVIAATGDDDIERLGIEFAKAIRAVARCRKDLADWESMGADLRAKLAAAETGRDTIKRKLGDFT